MFSVLYESLEKESSNEVRFGNLHAFGQRDFKLSFQTSVTCFTVLIHNKGMMIEGRYSRCLSLADMTGKAQAWE